LLNLVYALHYYKIGTCILNWNQPVSKDKKLRKLMSIPNDEIIIAMIACGNVQNDFKVTASKRKSLNKLVEVL
jgi:hypothetical protein